MSEAALAETAGLGHSQPAPEAVVAEPDALKGTEAAEAPDPREVLEGVATEMGWSPKDKWKGDPDKWRPAEEYIRNTPKVIKSLREQLERNQKVATQQIEKAREEAAADAKRRIAEAVEAGDKEAAERATDDLQRATSKPPAELEAFTRRNPWFQTDQVATSVAIAAAQKVADTGGSVAEQIAAGEKEVRKRFPELFEDEAPADPPARPQPPAVQGGQRSASGAPKKKGWADIPATTRQSITPKQLKVWGLTQEQYADSYWQENG